MRPSRGCALCPRESRKALAAQIDLLLDGDDLLTSEQWAAIEARLDSGEGLTPHEEGVLGLIGGILGFVVLLGGIAIVAMLLRDAGRANGIGV